MYIILSYYSDGSAKPEIGFFGDEDTFELISHLLRLGSEGRQIEAYRTYTDGSVDRIPLESDEDE